MTELLSPNQIGPASTKMSAASTFSKMAGQSSLSHPCSRISGHTPVAMSWSMARTTSTRTPLASMIRVLMSISPWVLLTSGDLLSVQLMNTARRPSNSVDGSGMVGAPPGAQRIGELPHRDTKQRNILDQELAGHRQQRETARGFFADTRSREQEADGRQEQSDRDHAAHRRQFRPPRLDRKQHRGAHLDDAEQCRERRHREHLVDPTHERAVGDQRLDALRLIGREFQQADPPDHDDESIAGQDTADACRDGFRHAGLG